MAESHVPDQESKTLPPDAIAALNKGNKIEAIKIVRVTRHIGLKQSKELVDTYLATQPALQRKIEMKQAEFRRGCLIWLVSATLLFVAAIYYLFLKPA